MKKNRNKYSKRLKCLRYVLVAFVYVLAFAIRKVCEWSVETFNVSLQEILYTITSPLKGTESSMVSQAFEYCVPTVLMVLFVYVCLVVLDCWNKVKIEIEIKIGKLKTQIELFGISRKIVILFAILTMLFSLGYVEKQYNVIEYIKYQLESSTIYEDYYVDPKKVNITSNGAKKNLICIYLESMETTYASREEGGQQEITYIPKLMELTKQGVSFSDKEEFGGFNTIAGTHWTMAALLATTSGIPFSFPVEANSMGKYEMFASGLTTLGDILEEHGYKQLFLCGSDAEFGGRKQYFEQHGNYDIFDLYTAREQNYLSDDYYKWWGFEDKYLFDIAKDQLLKLSEEDTPFNFTMLTVDTHPVGGYVCEWCKQTYDNDTANVISCSDRQIYEFVEWCREQSFYENTTIVLIGDHLRMDTCLMENVIHKDRRVYNCFLNGFAEIETQEVTKNRVFTTVDIFPTILTAMGFEYDGDRLGLGTNMFSGKKTIAEEIGCDKLNEELSKHSKYYLKNFQ